MCTGKSEGEVGRIHRHALGEHMPKNILIFSDGTGQAGGLRPDQHLSNIYKLYRATRPWCDSPIHPEQQVAFYDAGLGTDEDGGSLPFRAWRFMRKLFSSMTGTGLSRNITDCYAAILRYYQPGDRIYLFGFSRGAYTARCVANVLALCGVPSEDGHGHPLPRSGARLRAIAAEAVDSVYDHASRSANDDTLAQRDEKARRFRARYRSEGPAGEWAAPYFIGVFDTVASLGLSAALRYMLWGLMAAVVAGAYLVTAYWFDAPHAANVSAITAAAVLLALVLVYVVGRIRFIGDYPAKGKFRLSYSSGLAGSYDLKLDTRVGYARHAQAIDETRRDFARVGWGLRGARVARSENEPEWFKQIWFAGCHSDIGGSYSEDESRLSDVTLQWMIEQVQETPHPIIIDESKLRLAPSALGLQHCEIHRVRDAYPKWWFLPRWSWPEAPRREAAGATLHPTVHERFAARHVAHADGVKPYRPPTLAADPAFGHYFVRTEDTDGA